ncbi:MAG: type I restriction enzyme HsdR N-terminal domain-containing protein [Prevotellaceae bacterium]|jgi:hypothetical protein|nr:type I restriction enzyme HsdR N-terminal domain-containing protein [Prevotellaceae bacterium]
MYELNLPKYGIKIANENGHLTIFDVLRRKYVALTPEEWVRQHFVHYLIGHKGYPQTLMANEIQLAIGNKKLRCDSVLYDRSLKPRMIIEYKAPTVNITQKVFDQITVYNMLLHVDYLVVSNGIKHYCCQMDYDNQKYLFLEDIPDYQEIIT